MYTNTVTNQRYKNVITLSVMVLLTAVVLLFYFFTKNYDKHTNNKNVTDTHISQYVQPQEINLSGFDDGLGHPTDRVIKTIKNQTHTIDTFNHDINGDGTIDKITRTHIDEETAHFYDEYKIELNINGEFHNITPDDFRTINGADCALQLLHFTFSPKFHIKKISRPWHDTWTTPTLATKTEFAIYKNKLQITTNQPLTNICDVAELF